MSRMPGCVVALVLVLSVSARADEVVYQFQTEEDPTAGADPNACQVAPFEANVRLPASISVPESTEDGRLRPGGRKRAGTALACLRITDRTFSEGAQADIYASFELQEGHFAAVGRCTVVSNAVPRPGLVLASCALKLTEFPADYAGGSATSASVFNPLHLPGYDTGSLWTLRVLQPDPAAGTAPGGAGQEQARAAGGHEAPAK